MTIITHEQIHLKTEELSSPFDYATTEIAVILAAGHGKRIKSHRSKMLHTIWGIPTVQRVYNACRKAHTALNTIIVVGIKASEVMDVLGKMEHNCFAYQEQQNGTGHALQIALDKIDPLRFNGILYVFPGDMGLIDDETVAAFRADFIASGSDMMVLTGMYEGDIHLNSYGRIVRVKEIDTNGEPSGSAAGNVIAIIEHKDILALPPGGSVTLPYGGKEYIFSREELLELREYNSGVYAFRFSKVSGLAANLTGNNVQNEIYITDLIDLFNKAGYSVTAAAPKHPNAVMGFNDKTVLKEMDALYRTKLYNAVRNIIEIEDPEDFFIDDSILSDIILLDQSGVPTDIRIERGARLEKGVSINYNLVVRRNSVVSGSVIFGKNVKIGENVKLSAFPHQKIVIGEGTEIGTGAILKGNIVIGSNCRIESPVRITGSDDAPVRIGNNVTVKGASYLFGTTIDNDVLIQHSTLLNKHVRRELDDSGNVRSVRFYTPPVEGADLFMQ